MTMTDHEKYRQLLKDHDWTHEMSDDHRVWQEGREELATLNAEQIKLDPDFAVWNEICPPSFRR